MWITYFLKVTKFLCEFKWNRNFNLLKALSALCGDCTCALIFIAESEQTKGEFRKPYFINSLMVMWQA